MTRIALIHALAHSVAPINDAMARDWPQAMRMNLLDDSLSSDLAAGSKGLDASMVDRFARLAQYAVDCGSDAILFTCSAFGPCGAWGRPFRARRVTSSAWHPAFWQHPRHQTTPCALSNEVKA